MADVRHRPLPQFDPEDLRGDGLIYKLRTLVRDLELRESDAADKLAESLPGGLWFVGNGPPPDGLGNNGDYYLDAGDESQKVVHLKQGGEWQRQGVLPTDTGEDGPVSNIGNGAGLYAGESDGVARFKSLVAGGSVSLVEQDETVEIRFLGAVDGGYFISRKGAVAIQVARGRIANLPLLGRAGEPFWTEDTFELYFGTGSSMKPLRVRPENIIGLLQNGRIRSQFLPGGASGGGAVTAVNNLADRNGLDASEGDVAIVAQAEARRPAAYAYDGEQWRLLAAVAVQAGDIDSESAAAGQVLVSDGQGGASWRPPAFLYTTDGALVLDSAGALVMEGN